ncbi:MAG: M48 family metalloprotease, partial [Myxococcaceae bacterium]|nr:M48 family metalloprotease [Myxococcaceae bacterium]
AELWAEVEAVRRKLDGPRIHTLLLDSDFNASIVQLPRFGLLGPTKNYLVLGLPLMQALSREQFRAVLAHEFGHLSGAHGKLSAWVYRVRRTWGQVHEALEQREGWGVALFTRFFRWYAPFYAAYSFVLARSNEYEADRASADVVGRGTAADALVAVWVRGALLDERFWPSVRARAAKEAEPARPFAEMPAALQGGLEPVLAMRWLTSSLERQTDTTDTHPSLRDRLAALGEPARLPGPLAQSAAEALLGPALPTLIASLDGEWKDAVVMRWREEHAAAQEKQRRLEELESVARGAELSEEQEWERADLTEDVHGADAAIPLLRELLVRSPAHASANFTLGRLLLAREEASGLEHLEAAMKRSVEAVVPASRIAAAFFARQGRAEEARTWFERGEAWARKLEESKEERDSLRQSDSFAPHGVAEEALQALAAQLHGHARVQEAWLVRKVVAHFPEKPLFVLGLHLGKEPAQGADSQLVSELSGALHLPGEAFVVSLGKKNAKLAESVKGTAGTPFYVRSRWTERASNTAA